MATRIQASEENVLAPRNAKLVAKPPQQSLLEQGSKRRVLNDIGNIVPANRNASVKELKTDALQSKARTASKETLAAKGPSIIPRTRYQTRAAVAASSVVLSTSGQLQVSSEEAAAVSRLPSPTPALPDIDTDDINNPLAASDYVNDIFNYYKRAEPKFRIPADYMTTQNDINEKMRGILVDWLVEVHLKFKLLPETLFLSVNLIDRFLAKKTVTRRNLQLVGVTAMLISAKYEEIWAPEVRDFVYISDKAYNRDQILAMEKDMLSSLGFNLTLPTQFNFLGRFIKAAGSLEDKRVCHLASYLVELSLADYASLRYSYSMIAAAAVYLARKSFSVADPYPLALQRHSTYDFDSLKPCIDFLVQIMGLAASTNLTAVYKKYNNPKYLEVAKQQPPAEIF